MNNEKKNRVLKKSQSVFFFIFRVVAYEYIIFRVVAYEYIIFRVVAYEYIILAAEQNIKLRFQNNQSQVLQESHRYDYYTSSAGDWC